MRLLSTRTVVLWIAAIATAAAWGEARGEVRTSQGTVTIATYPWAEDINPRFWALEHDTKLSLTVPDVIVYPYVMQDHLSRRKVDRTYKALFLENEYLKVTCLPELGGRLHSVLDKTQNKEMFHLNRVIKPGMIAMRGAFISGGAEWNSGPHGHTVSILSPVDAIAGKNPDGSAYLEISNLEQIFRTRWTVRVTLHPGRAYLDEQIRLENPNDGMHPYYFWNCTAFPNRPATRFIFPMSLGTDHGGRQFFRWPVDKGRDLSWLKDYPIFSSIFAVNCTYDFFGAYDGDADRGVVQAANHGELGGKKAWTWGEWEFGKVAQKNLTDDDGPYIEVQSGPLPTQSDYGMLAPRDVVKWQEWWYPVHGFGGSFEFATRDLAAETIRHGDRLELRLLATGRFPQAQCVLARNGRTVLSKRVDLTPNEPAVVLLNEDAAKPVDITVSTKEGRLLARYTSPLPIPKVEPPDPAKFVEKPDDQMSVEELFLKGRKADRGTERRAAREYYEKALARDPGHVDSLLGLAVLDFEAALHPRAIERVKKALDRDSDRGLAWYYQGVCNLRLGNVRDAMECGYHAARCPGTVALGYDLVGRAVFRQGDPTGAAAAFRKAVAADGCDRTAMDHLLLALYATGQTEVARKRMQENPTALVPRAIVLQQRGADTQFGAEARSFLGENEFEMLETSLTFAECGLVREAERIVHACIDATPRSEQSFMPCYYLAWYASLRGDKATARQCLAQAAATPKECVFASRPEEVDMLRYAVQEKPDDAQAHLQLGCLLANLGRIDEAVGMWEKAAALDAKLSIAWRGLGLVAMTKHELPKAASLYRKAVDARPGDQTLYRDLAEILTTEGKRGEAIKLLEAMPVEGMRRAEITVMMAQAYQDEHRDADCIKLLESTPYFVNWEGQDVTWRFYNQAHIEHGRRLLEQGNAQAALADFEAALRYPANLNVGRPAKPQEAPAQYWRGKALQALGRGSEARAAWKAGADGADISGTQNEYRQKCREAMGNGDSAAKKANG